MSNMKGPFLKYLKIGPPCFFKTLVEIMTFPIHRIANKKT